MKTMNRIIIDTPHDIEMAIANNFRAIRKSKHVTMKELSRRSDVSYSSIKRFESTGKVSMQSLVKMSYVLGIEKQLKNLFSDVPPTTIEEFLAR